jgi:biopolymer transport protein ExbB/TolQ
MQHDEAPLLGFWRQTPSATETAKMEAKRKAGPRVLSITGIVLCTGPLWGLLVTCIIMLQTFDATAETGSAPPDAVARSVVQSLWATSAGLIALPFGIAAVIAAIVWRRRIAKKEQEERTA